MPLTYEWDFNADGTVDSTVANPPAYTFTKAGAFKAEDYGEYSFMKHGGCSL